MHPFEKAGLGVAPFRWVGAFNRDYNCEFCGTAIVINCRVQDANGKEFIVGSDCILRVGDAHLGNAVKNYRKQATKQAQLDRVVNLAEILRYDHPLRAKLAIGCWKTLAYLVSFEWPERSIRLRL
jgi:hypothetical protein